MKLLITENKLKKLINKMIGYDLTDRIRMITNWIELGTDGQKLFTDGRDEFRWLLNHYGPWFEFDINGNYYYIQHQGKEFGWLVLSGKQNGKIDEYEFKTVLGIEYLGLDLNDIINAFVED